MTRPAVTSGYAQAVDAAGNPAPTCAVCGSLCARGACVRCGASCTIPPPAFALDADALVRQRDAGIEAERALALNGANGTHPRLTVGEGQPPLPRLTLDYAAWIHYQIDPHRELRRRHEARMAAIAPGGRGAWYGHLPPRGGK